MCIHMCSCLMQGEEEAGRDGINLTMKMLFEEAETLVTTMFPFQGVRK